MLYNYQLSNSFVRKSQVPSAANYVFQPPTTLPVLRVTGAGVPVQKQIRALQPPQVMFAQTAPQAGYGGLSAGMMYGYPLAINPLGQPANQFSGIS